MKIAYYSETDTLYIRLREGTTLESQELAQDLVADLDQEGSVLGIEIEHASQRVELGSLAMENFALKTA